MSVFTSETLKQGNSPLIPQKIRRKNKQINKQNVIICEVLGFLSFKTVKSYVMILIRSVYINLVVKSVSFLSLVIVKI